MIRIGLWCPVHYGFIASGTVQGISSLMIRPLGCLKVRAGRDGGKQTSMSGFNPFRACARARTRTRAHGRFHLHHEPISLFKLLHSKVSLKPEACMLGYLFYIVLYWSST